MKNKFYKFFAVCLLVLSVGVIAVSLNQQSASAFSIDIYTVNSGYGYSISKDDKLLIKQDAIPSVEAQMAFCDANDAKRIAQLVVEKLENRENPRITKTELEQKHIALKCVH